MSIVDFKNSHKLIKEWTYELKPIYRGYNDRILYVNLSDNYIKEKPVPPIMKEKFIGGKGYGLKLLWEATKSDTKWNDPENEIIINTGPICGIMQYSGTGKSLVVTISPLTDIVID
ncbi:MAG TPA: aldehyde ferredoxin oxidoreductase N-terminal domain-containing protein, partial [Bacteroidales bacterium]|nr:aldehyde ferredoxin oxidoreductase N-terminal domain-containing protein [Bacteroidales bacterium]